MAASITTFNGLRCTVRPRTQIFTAISPPATTTTTTATATATNIPATINTSPSQTDSAAVQNTSTANPVSSILSQSGNSGPASNPTSFVTSAIATSSGVTAVAATLSPVFTSLTDPSSTPASGSNSSGVTSGPIPSKNVVGAAVGASLGAVAVVLMIILCAFFRRRKRRTPSQLNAGEKGPSARVVAGMKQSIGKTASRSIAAFKTGFNDKYQGALAGIRNLRFKKGEDSNDTAAAPPAMQTASSQRLPPFNFSKRTPLVKENISRAPVPVSEFSNPFADPPSRVGPTTTQNDAVGLNPFADSAAEHYNDIPFSLPLTVRNSDMDGIDSVDVDVDDDHDDHDLDRNRHETRDQNENQDTTLRGSLFNLNLPDPRASSPLMPQNWTLTDWSGKDRSSTYSDPFDLERPPTIHSSVHPTPMMERQESEQRGGYFQGLTHGSPVYIS